MLDVSLPNRTEPTLYAFILVFVLEKRRLLNTHFEERMYNVLASWIPPENHMYETATLCDYCPEWQVHFIMHASLID